MPQKQRKRRRLPGSSAGGIVRHGAKRPNHVWSYDFLADRTEDGRQMKLLAVAVDTLYIKKGSPWENGYVESFGWQAAG